MDIKTMVAELHRQRTQLDQAIAALEGLYGTVARRRGRPPKNPQAGNLFAMPKRRTMSPAARKRISEMMKKRWAERKRKRRAA